MRWDGLPRIRFVVVVDLPWMDEDEDSMRWWGVTIRGNLCGEFDRRFVLMWLAWRHHGNHSTNINWRNYISSKAQPPAGSDSTGYLDVVEGIICHLIPEQEFRWSLELEISVLYGPASSDQEFFAFIRCCNSAYIALSCCAVHATYPCWANQLRGGSMEPRQINF